MLLFCIAIATGCENVEHKPLVEDASVPPKPTVTATERLNGGAKITFSIPDDPNILYVTAFYEHRKGEMRETKSSTYKNFIELLGFADTLQHRVTLHAVSRSNVMSEPTEVTIKPLPPLMDDVRNSLRVVHDFGGINAKFTNDAQREYVFYTIIKDSLNEWISYDRLFTSAKFRDYSVRGLPSNPIDFGFYFRDEWGNFSDTLFLTLTPLYEEMLNKKLWKTFPLPSDTYTNQPGWKPVSAIWDGEYNILGSLHYQALSGAKMPNWFTIDLGQKAVFSRLVVFQAPSQRPTYAYNYGTPRLYEIWGSNEPTDSWDNWSLLLECESIKPSGLPPGQRTAEDSAYAMEGENYNFPPGIEAYRYIRFKTLKSWTSTQALMLMEIDLFGQPLN